MTMNDKTLARKIAIEVNKAGGSAYYVGGYVRDDILGIHNKDIDIEIHNIKPETLENILKQFGRLQARTVGNNFGIYNIKGFDIDISLPRKEKAIGTGHKDFEIVVDPYLSLEDSAKRRDFTINALMKDVLTDKIIDYYDGLKDLKKGVIRHINDNTFVEDPLRVLRACQFAARFNFTIDSKTIELCKTMDISTLPKERIACELTKALIKGDKPSIFFNLLYEMNQTEWFKEVFDLKDVKQDTTYHPEGDVYGHTMSVIDEASTLFSTGIDNPDRYLPFMLSALCHDFGKVNTTKINNKGRICAINHEKTGIPLANDFLDRIYNNKSFTKYVDNMIEYHMKAHSCFNNKAKVKTTNLLFDEILYPKDFIHLAYADSIGHNTLKLDNRQFDMFLKKAMAENEFLIDRYFNYGKRISEPHIMADDLIELGLKPSPLYKEILDKSWNLHLKGVNKENVLKQVADTLSGKDKRVLLDLINIKEQDEVNKSQENDDYEITN